MLASIGMSSNEGLSPALPPSRVGFASRPVPRPRQLGDVSRPCLPARSWFSVRNYGFSDGADLFVFISGYTSALVFAGERSSGASCRNQQAVAARMANLRGPYPAVRVLPGFRPFPLNRFNAPDLVDLFNAAPVTSAPVEMITQGLLLRYKPLNLDVLPLYVVLMGVFPPVL